RSSNYGSGLEAVSIRKQRDIARVANGWLLRHGRPGDEYRFDLVLVKVGLGGKHSVEHVPDAWRLNRQWAY
ncbi:MAG: YraN family protein, partial [Gemmatimonadales bacterium]